MGQVCFWLLFYILKVIIHYHDLDYKSTTFQKYSIYCFQKYFNKKTILIFFMTA